MTLCIRWIVDWKFEGPTPEQSPIASMRYRVLIPAKALGAVGHRVEVVKLDALRAGQTLAWEGVDVLVVGKLFPDLNSEQFAADSRHLLAHCAAARAAGVRVVSDINDDHFSRPVFGDHWRSLAAFSDLCVVGSARMGATVAAHSKRPVAIVGDPLGSPMAAPRVYADRAGGALSRLFRAEPLRLVWYGMTNNIPALEPWAMFIGAAWTDTPLQLQVITRRHGIVDELCARFNERFGKQTRMEFVEWDETLQWRLVGEADVVLIPSDAGDPAKAVKSANRLTDALHAGRYVIASPIPSYLPYAEHAALTDNPVQALHAYMKDPDAARARIARGQATVLAEWSLERIAGLWVQAFDQARASHVTTASDVTAASPALAPVRLNLGCGDKILPGYVNVDVVEARAGKSPDVLSDLRQLTAFADESVDEVMAIHVVEHFWRWEVEAVLREWLRVLKPGGAMVLECPDLRAACEAFLRDPDASSGPGPEAQTTMWVFYGDPAWKDPLMVHRWGYTPRSLSTLMESVGLVDVHQEPAQFKRREPRDMRIVGRKPAALPIEAGL